MNNENNIEEENQAKTPTVSGHVEPVVSDANRHFIIFYKAQNQSSYQYGQKYIKSNKLPFYKLIQDEIAKDISFTSSDVNILGFSEVSFEDCVSYFNNG